MKLDRICFAESPTCDVVENIKSALEKLPDNFVHWKDVASSAKKRNLPVSFGDANVIFYPVVGVVSSVVIPEGSHPVVKHNGTYFIHENHSYCVKPFTKS